MKQNLSLQFWSRCFISVSNNNDDILALKTGNGIYQQNVFDVLLHRICCTHRCLSNSVHYHLTIKDKGLNIFNLYVFLLFMPIIMQLIKYVLHYPLSSVFFIVGFLLSWQLVLRFCCQRTGEVIYTWHAILFLQLLSLKYVWNATWVGEI